LYHVQYFRLLEQLFVIKIGKFAFQYFDFMGQIQCPDCESIRWGSLVPTGDGKCSHCQGTGKLVLYEDVTDAFLTGEDTCRFCSGTRQCQTCGGTGRIEDDTEDSYTEEENTDEESYSEEDE
jgi:DnaJ-class molecular chaperone